MHSDGRTDRQTDEQGRFNKLSTGFRMQLEIDRQIWYRQKNPVTLRVNFEIKFAQGKETRQSI
jgi:hypothetical protein